jgi:hypothetical protein
MAAVDGVERVARHDPVAKVPDPGEQEARSVRGRRSRFIREGARGTRRTTTPTAANAPVALTPTASRRKRLDRAGAPVATRA